MSPEVRLSKYSIRPSLILAGVMGLSPGTGTGGSAASRTLAIERRQSIAGRAGGAGCVGFVAVADRHVELARHLWTRTRGAEQNR